MNWTEEAEKLGTGALEAQDFAALTIPEEGLLEAAQWGLGALRVELSRAEKVSQGLILHSKAARSPLAQGLGERLAGHVKLLSGRPKAAISLYRKAIRRFLHHPAEKAGTGAGMVQALAYLGNYEESFQVGEEASRYFVETGEELKAARIRSNMANALHRLDRVEDACEVYKEALEVIARLGSATDTAIVMRNYAVSLMALRDFDAAEELYLHARAVFEASSQTPVVLEVDLNRAYLMGRRGLILEALRMYRAVLQSLPAEDDFGSFEIGHGLLDQADFMLEVGLWNDAALAANKAASVFASLGLPFEKAKAELLEAFANMRRGVPADELIERSSQGLKKEPNKVWKALSFQARAESLRRKGEFGKSSKFLTQALRLTEASQNTERRIDIVLDLADLSLRQSDWQKAEDLLRDLDGINSVQSCRRQALLAKSARLSGRSELASELATEAVQLFDASRTALSASSLRQALRGSLSSSLEEALRCSQSVGRRFSIIRRLKNQTLAELLSSPVAQPQESEARRLKEQLFSLRETSLGAPMVNAALRDELERRLEAETRSLDTWAHASSASDSDLSLPAGVVCLELFEIDEEVRAMVIHHDGMREEALGSREEFQRQARFLRHHLSRGLRSDSLAETNRILAWFGEKFAPLLPGPTLCPQLVICVSPSLRSIPLHIIPFEGAPLLESFEVVYAPSTDAWNSISKRAPSPKSAAIIVATPDELAPQIQVEAEQIKEIFGPSCRLLGADADEAAVMEGLEAAGVIHLAAHGIHREDRPVFSCLRLGTFDLSAFEVTNLRMDSNLVSLSGCGTGLSSLTESSDTQGLIEAFLYAGARTVLASLWDVDDVSSSHFMVEVCRGLKDGLSVPLALRKAAGALRLTHPHPVHWGAFWAFGAAFLKECIFADPASPN